MFCFVVAALWMMTGERHAARTRNYLKTILRQDVSFFDKETNVGEVVDRMSGWKIHTVNGNIGGFLRAYAKGLLLTLVMLTSIPSLVIYGSLMSVTIDKMASRSQIAYAKAATVVEQALGSISKKKAVEDYSKSAIDAWYQPSVVGLVEEHLRFGDMVVTISCMPLSGLSLERTEPRLRRCA
ncbi:ABC transporter B family member 12-like [Bidens hawaiensis]|uniref:ABC transporter B family member 12-like n=1 Tax=Bidens hawaiensis TaxID=980011 RepID=UPI00404A02C2